MADFIAVIRRAVDGLSDNTPEMRAKVYERARSAVVRQLENMKPRPPEVMFQKQLDKLDAAIRQVEEEHAEALPAEGSAAAEGPAPTADPQQVDVAPEPAAEVHSEPPPLIQEEPVERQQEPAAEHVEALESAPGPEAAIEEVPESTGHYVDEQDDAPVIVAEAPVPDGAAMAEVEGRSSQEYAPSELVSSTTRNDDEPLFEPPAAEETVDYRSAASADVVSIDQAVPHEEPAFQEESVTRDAADQAAEPELFHAEPEAANAEQASGWPVERDREPEPAAEIQPEAAVPMPKVAYAENDVVSDFSAFVQHEMSRSVVPPPPRKAEQRDDFSWDAPFDDLPEIPKPDSFEKALEAKQKEIASAKPSARAELEDLIGFEREPAAAPVPPSTASFGDLPPEVTKAVGKLEGKRFRAQNKKKKAKSGSRIKPLFLALGVVGAVAVAGGAYALWHFQNDVTQFAANLFPKSEPATPADAGKAVADAADKPATEKAADAGKETQVASLATGPQKFTQRLNSDGTETDALAASVTVDQALKEGKSIAGQTEPGKKVASNEATPNDSKPADQSQAPAPALGATQKMFLYEERLGQTSPVASTGTVLWSEKTDTKDGKPNPSVEAKLDIPDRKISALLSIKRNTDPSLPASHIVEIVFALPKDFPEGNIESIQRIAFKQTEQDRGNPLIAVPAKITDDFHMVALNDDSEARSTNLELMKSRSWIDIPITYRNGRRALITLEKGSTGSEIFDRVFKEWSALGEESVN